MPGTVDAEARTVEVVWSTERPVLRQSWDGPFYEELSVSADAVDLSRLNAGAPLLNAHDGGGDALRIIGTVEPGSVRLSGGQGVATVRFDSGDNDPDAERIFRKVQSGIITGVSVGYRVHKMQKTKRDIEGVPVYRVTKWEPYEISVAPVPADIDSKFRSMDMSEEIKVQSVPAQVEERAMAPAPAPVDVDAVRAAERARVQEIRKVFRSAGLDESLSDSLVESGAGVDAARKVALDALVERDRSKPVPTPGVQARDDSVDRRRSGMADAIAHRASGGELSDVARQFRGWSMLDVARECIEQSGQSTRGMSRDQIARIALRSGSHSTSDFPLILADAAGKVLRNAYAAAAVTFEPFVRRVTVPDFKSRKVTQLGEASLSLVTEGGEYKSAGVSEGRESYSLNTYGRIFAITRQALVNDDLDAFSRIPLLFGNAARQLEADVVYSHLTGGASNLGPTMGDGVQLFNASHGNVGTGVIDVTNIGAGRAAMRKQTGLNGQRINVAARYLLVHPDRETVADQFVSTALLASAAGSVNPFAGRLVVISEARLPVAAAWHLVADPSQIDTIEVATLEGESGPRVTQEEGFEVDGMRFKCSHDFAAKVIDWRGFYRSTGS